MKRYITHLLLLTIVTFSVSQAMFDEKEKSMVVITCMHNNAAWVKDNLSMIFAQNYTNFRLIIVDDASTDNTTDIIEEFIVTHSLEKKITFIKNKTRKRKLANLYNVLYTVDDKDIVVIIDGDDWLAHSHVFSYINNLYNKDIFFTYGQYENVPASEAIAWGFNPMGYAKPVPKDIIKNHSYRKGPFYYMHLRTFKGWIFKMIKLQDLLTDTVEGFVGDFFPASNDLAMYYPIVEMAHTKIHFVDQIIYTRNLYSNLVGFKVDRSIQLDSAREIKRKKPYDILDKPVYRHLNDIKKKPVDFVICTSDQQKCFALKKMYKHATVIKAEDVHKKMDTLLNEYVMIVCDEQCVPSSKTIKQMAYQLERTFASSLFIMLNKEKKDILKNAPVACLQNKKLYACKNRFLPKVIIDHQDIKGILLRMIDFKETIKHVGTIENIVALFLQNTDENISLVYFEN